MDGVSILTLGKNTILVGFLGAIQLQLNVLTLSGKAVFGTVDLLIAKLQELKVVTKGLTKADLDNNIAIQVRLPTNVIVDLLSCLG